MNRPYESCVTPFKHEALVLFEDKKMSAKTSWKKWTIATVVIVIAAGLAGTLLAYPTFGIGQQPSQQAQTTSTPTAQDFTFNDTAWNNLDQFPTMNNAPLKGENVTAECKGWAFQRIDNETIKQYTLELNITIELGATSNHMVSIVNVTGSISINSTSFNTVYTIQTGEGIIGTNRDVALIKAQGINGQDNVTLKLEARYFYWGGKTFAFRGRALLEQTGQKPMLLLLRYGIAKAQ